MNHRLICLAVYVDQGNFTHGGNWTCSPANRPLSHMWTEWDIILVADPKNFLVEARNSLYKRNRIQDYSI